MSNRVYQWSAALQRFDGTFRLVGVAYAEDEYPDAKERALEHFHAWKRDIPKATVFLRRPIVPWELTDAD